MRRPGGEGRGLPGETVVAVIAAKRDILAVRGLGSQHRRESRWLVVEPALSLSYRDRRPEVAQTVPDLMARSGYALFH